MKRVQKYLLLPTSNQKQSIDKVLQQICKLHNLYVKDILLGIKHPSNNKILLDYYLNKYFEFKPIDYSIFLNELDNLTNNPYLRQIIKESTSFITTYFLDKQDIIPITNAYVYLPGIGDIRYQNDRPLPKDYVLLSFKVSRTYDDKYYLEITYDIRETIDDKPILNYFNNSSTINVYVNIKPT